MKRHILHIIMALLVLGATSCDDFLEVDNHTATTEDNFYQTEEDAYAALYAAYNATTDDKGGTNEFEFFLNMCSDDMFTGGGSSSDGTDIRRFEKHKMLATDWQHDQFWWRGYVGIYRANVALEKIPQITFADENEKARILAELKFIRAYIYSNLVRMYENIPLITEPITLADAAVGQANPDDVYEQIATDFLAAIEGLPETVEGEEGRVTKYAAQALLARMYLFYTGFYGQAEMPGVTLSSISSLLDNVIEDNHYGLVDNFANLWLVSGSVEAYYSKEHVYQIPYSYNGKGTSRGDVQFYGLRDLSNTSTYAAGWGFGTIHPNVYAIFDANDERRNATILDANDEVGENGYSNSYQHTGYYFKKFTPLSEFVDDAAFSGHPDGRPVVRYADVLLMAAELSLNGGSFSREAQSYYEEVRVRAGFSTHPPVSLDRVYEERRKEFFGEGLRYWDLLRRGLDVADATITNNYESPFDVTFDRETRGVWPIADVQIQLSSSSAKPLKQNQGY
ncbi:RagB/SusD family nutrient uptake outer membrane protein [Carboxylicivirga marina]|uniref:RagB/SusD family nutrient uptake outer membrane protein n=1 Tax=Carboxylicivirga marina TaxID=2800988 RepID=A0ABS1HHH3_9BACT|nr:RagB/SusD family nutrient uptake outer membrane protein [Carboxylicivirga marina]MBK3517127.1 RagB/SusD family nutrient uptake outer membrane protein [Carboxylicivirga marina]